MVEIVSGRADPTAVDRLLRSLPDWFGIEASIVEYVRDAGAKPTYLAIDESGDVVGVMLVTHHNASTTEIHLMAVAAEHQRRGVGRALVGALERDLQSTAVRLLEVKTVGPSMAYEPYARTRAFYAGVGFMPLEELDGLWPGNPCLIMVKPLAA
jgi:GNAT superfamily N-acetyltransferase